MRDGGKGDYGGIESGENIEIEKRKGEKRDTRSTFIF